MIATSCLHPREEILQAMDRIYRYRMTTTSGGNLSIRETNGDIWITPARVDKGSLGPADIVLVRADGTIEGKHPPSSELPLHQAIYKARPEVRGVVHAHPVALVAFSLVHQVPNTRLFHQAWQVCGEPGFAPYELPGTAALGASVAGAFAKGHVYQRYLTPGRHDVYASRPSRTSDSWHGTLDVRPGETYSFVVSCTPAQVILSPVSRID